MNILALSSTGELSLVAGDSPSLKLEFDTYSYLASAEINVAFLRKFQAHVDLQIFLCV